MPLITNTGDVIEDGTPFEIAYDGDNVDYIDYAKGDSVYRQTFTYSGTNLVSVTIPTLVP
jgi:hypothetical protein